MTSYAAEELHTNFSFWKKKKFCFYSPWTQNTLSLKSSRKSSKDLFTCPFNLPHNLFLCKLNSCLWLYLKSHPCFFFLFSCFVKINEGALVKTFSDYMTKAKGNDTFQCHDRQVFRKHLAVNWLFCHCFLFFILAFMFKSMSAFCLLGLWLCSLLQKFSISLFIFFFFLCVNSRYFFFYD